MANMSRSKMALAAVAMLISVSMMGIVSDSGSSNADLNFTEYTFTAQTGVYYEFDTNIPSNYAIPVTGYWSLSKLPIGMNLNTGGDIVGTPLMPGHHRISFFPGGIGNANSILNGEYIRVNITVIGEPASGIVTSIAGSTSISVNKDTVPIGSYNKTTLYFENIFDKIEPYFGEEALTKFNVYVSSNYIQLDQLTVEGGITIRPVILDFSSVTYTTSTTLFSNVAFSNGTLSFDFNPSSYGVYAVGLWILSEGPGYGGESNEFVCLKVYEYGTPINVSDQTVVCGQNLILTPVSSGEVSVSGASWLSASGNVISGVAPSEPGVYTVTVTAGGSSATFTVTVVSKLIPTNSPTNGALIMPR